MALTFLGSAQLARFIRKALQLLMRWVSLPGPSVIAGEAQVSGAELGSTD